MATEEHITQADAAIQAIEDSLAEFFAGDWQAAWLASEPMTADELAVALTPAEGRA